MAGRLLETLRGADPKRRPIWLDAVDYGRQVILRGAALPWGDTAAFIAFEREIHALLQADIAAFDVAAFYDDYLRSHDDLRSSMAGNRRPGFALKTLLAAPGPREGQLGSLRGMRTSFSARPLVLVIPSPQRWIGTAHGAANGIKTIDVSLDDAESGAVYVADFLSHFADAGIDGVLLVEPPGSAFDVNEQLDAYQPIVNVATHYRWDLGIRAFGARYTASNIDRLAYGISDGTPLAPVHAAVLAPDYWQGGEPPPAGHATFYYGRIPTDAVPELVLQQLDRLRG